MCTAVSTFVSEAWQARMVLALWTGLVLLPVQGLAQGSALQKETPLLESELVDPLDGQRFTVQVLGATDALGGFDSDGCSYAAGAQARTWGVATSPTTLYSAPVDKWGAGVTEANREELMAVLLGLGADVDSGRELPTHQRYELAARVAEITGQGSFVVGELLLSGAWTVRDSIVGFLPGVQGASDGWQKLTETLPAVRAVDNNRGRTIASFDMARLCHRGGFVMERDDFLALLDTFPDAGIGGLEKRTEFLRRVGEENRLLRSARAAFRKGLEGAEATAEKRAGYRFLVADLSRRLGEFDEAARQLEAVALDREAPDEVKAMVADVKKVLEVQGRKRSAVSEDVAPSFQEGRSP